MTTYLSTALAGLNDATPSGMRKINTAINDAFTHLGANGGGAAADDIAEALRGQLVRLNTIAAAAQLVETALTNVSLDASFSSLAAGVQSATTAALAAIAAL